MKTQNPLVDTYLAQAAPFAQPILAHLRGLLHKACPGVIEEMKWSRPFFLHRGEILCNISAFKAHCSLGFWGAEIGKVLLEQKVVADGAMGTFGRITSLSDLPSDKVLLGYMRQAAGLIESGQGANRGVVARRVVKAVKPPVETPLELLAALAKNKGAQTAFDGFSASCQREYAEWIGEAKRAETRDRRVEQAVAMMAEGKQRNWKYQGC